MVKFTFALLLVSSSLLAQKTDTTAGQSNEEIFTFVDISAEFIGGQDAMNRFLASNIKYPKEARSKKLQGRVFVKFVIERDGSISNVGAVKGVSPEIDEEAVRVVSSMPKWKPAEKDGKVVRMAFTLPLTFKLTR